MGRKAKKRSGPVTRVPQFDLSTRTLEHIEKAFDKLNISGHKAIYKTGGMIVSKLVEKSLGKGFVKVRMLDGGMLEFEKEAPTSMGPESFPIGHASKETRLEHGMKPDPSEQD